MTMKKFWLSREVFLGLTFGVLMLGPAFAFGSKDVIFVDKDASGTEEGTYARPYRTISRALKHADEGAEVRVKDGTYKENITIPKDVTVTSEDEDRDDVVIEADNEDQPTVTMKHDAALQYVTIKGGRHGIRVKEDAKAHIYNVLVKKSDRDGIHIDVGPRDKKHRVVIDKVRVIESDRAGIYAEKRNVVILRSEIERNASDGVDFAAGTKAWLEDNTFRNNNGSGLKLILDGSEIWTKKNSFRDNRREGIEVNLYGATGQFGLKKATIIGNGRYGIAKVARTASGYRAFGGVILESGVNVNRIEGNHIGNISAGLRGF